jgi:hypothetical protein
MSIYFAQKPNAKTERFMRVEFLKRWHFGQIESRVNNIHLKSSNIPGSYFRQLETDYAFMKTPLGFIMFPAAGGAVWIAASPQHVLFSTFICTTLIDMNLLDVDKQFLLFHAQMSRLPSEVCNLRGVQHLLGASSVHGAREILELRPGLVKFVKQMILK